MSAQPKLTSDLEGLARQVDPLSRRGFFLATSAAAAAGYTLAAGPVRADAIQTDTNGLTVGDAKVKVAGGDMPVYFARPANVPKPPIIIVAPEIFGLHEYIKDVVRRARQPRGSRGRPRKLFPPGRKFDQDYRNLSALAACEREVRRGAGVGSRCGLWNGQRREAPAATPAGSASSASAAVAVRSGSMRQTIQKSQGGGHLLRNQDGHGCPQRRPCRRTPPCSPLK